MKKLLVILMGVVGFSAYAAGSLSLYNESTNNLAVEYWPSGFVFNGIRVADGYCKCPVDDTVMYFGPVGMPQKQTYLDDNTTFTPLYISGKFTGYHVLGNGNVWKVLKDTTIPGDKEQNCTVNGTTDISASCSFN